MQVQFPAYHRLLLTFYSKITKHHPSSAALTKNLQTMAAQLQAKDQTEYHHPRPLRTHHKKSMPSLPARSVSHAKMGLHSRGKKMGGFDPIYSSQIFGSVFAFAYLYTIVETSNAEIMKMIETKVNLLTQSDFREQFKDKSQWEHNLMEWKKITHVIAHKNTVKWDKILQNSFSSFDPLFVQMLLKSILSISVGNKLDLQPNYDTLKRVSSQLKVSIVLYYLQADQIKDKKIVGVYKTTVKIVAEDNNNIYYFTSKPPGEQVESEYYNEEIQNSWATKNNMRSMKSAQMDIKQKVNPSSQRNSEKSLKSLAQVKSAHLIQRMQSNEASFSAKESPEKAKRASNYRLVAKKTLITIQFLMKQYNLNSIKLKSLECFDTEIEMNTGNQGSSRMQNGSVKHLKFY